MGSTALMPTCQLLMSAIRPDRKLALPKTKIKFPIAQDICYTGFFLCHSGASIRYLLWKRQLHKNYLGISFPIARTSVAQKNCFVWSIWASCFLDVRRHVLVYRQRCVFATEKNLPIAKNDLKISKGFSEQYGPSTHKIKGLIWIHTNKFTRSKPKTWEDIFLGNTCSGLNFDVFRPEGTFEIAVRGCGLLGERDR